MEAHETDNIVGMREDDGCVKCKTCMNEEDWEILTQENAITSRNSKVMRGCEIDREIGDSFVRIVPALDI